MLSATALYSSGPVTPSMRNRPCGSWWPSERHSRAVSTSSSSPTSRSNVVVVGRVVVARDGVGDVGVDVERGRARRPVARALLPADRPPRERGAREAELLRALAREVERHVPPAQRVARGVRRRVGEHRQDEALGVPERVAVVARDRSGPSPRSRAARRARRPGACGRGRSGPPAAARCRPRARRRRAPRTSSRYARCAASRPSQPVCVASAERRDHLVAERRERALARPAVGEELHDAEALPLARSAATVTRPTSGLLSAMTSVPSGPSTM